LVWAGSLAQRGADAAPRPTMGEEVMRRLAASAAHLAAGALCVVALIVALAVSAGAATPDVVDRSALRVCADPANLPFSNRAGEGFENKIAELLAAELGVPVQYTWFPQATGFVRNTLRAHKCDIVIGISLGFELLQNTNPYYRSAYSLVYRDGDGLELKDLDAPVLQTLKLGVVAGTPPANIMAVHGLMTRVRPYQLVVDTRFDRPGEQMVADISSGEIDVGVLWGPIAGYYAKSYGSALKVVPLRSREGEPRMDYRITMGIRFNEPDWKHQLNELIKIKQPEINAILQDYGVPLLDEHENLIPPLEKRSSLGGENAGVAEPPGYRMDDYRAPTPATLAGATVDTTESAKALAAAGGALFIDVLPRPPKPAGLPEGMIWQQRPRHNIPGSVWLPNTGYGALSEETEAYFRGNLERLTGGDTARTLVFYCLADCWMSWNAAKRALAYGYSDVHWYPEGTDGWSAAGLPVESCEPVAALEIN
jgi:quinoprotein dehydrogenase-associated probable ABC transporter substrate-binding protein/PQQ-dependent catabolism-associated CXXCW motif protein